MSKNFQKKECYSSLKFAIWNQKAIFNSSLFYFSICKSQEDYSSWFTKRKIRNASKLSKQEKCKQVIQTREMQQGCPNKQDAQTEPNKQQNGK